MTETKRIANLYTYLKHTREDRIIVRTSYVAGCWYDNEFYAHAAGFEISRQEKQIRKYAGEIDQMDDRIRSLTSSRDSLEKFAREHFHFAEPGDDVFIIEDKK